MRLIGGTACYGQEILTRGTIHLNVAGANVMLVTLQRHVAMLLRDEAYQGFTVAPSQRRQAQSDSASVEGGRERERVKGLGKGGWKIVE